MKQKKTKSENGVDKDHLSQEDLKAGMKTFKQTNEPHSYTGNPGR